MKFVGKSVFKGVARGPIFVLKKKEVSIAQGALSVDEEMARLAAAKEQSLEQLQRLYEKAFEEVGEESAAIFEVHQMMLDDDDFNEAVEAAIQDEGLSAEAAVMATGEAFAEMFASMDDDYMRARAADIKDISGRLVTNLQGGETSLESLPEPMIIVADDLTPSETVSMDKKNVLAFVTVHGSSNSHTAILARMMNIPAMIGVSLDLDLLETGTQAVVDAVKGVFITEPGEKDLKEAEEKMKQQAERAALLQTLRGKENVTKGGRHIHIFANVGSVDDVPYALENDASGIGLFRSEFLYIGRDSLPSEEEQFEAYKKTVELMGDKKVVIRTLDIGADKQADYLNLGKEDNPALGYRAIRICLTEKDIFKRQLRALFRASVYGNLSIMYPMITSVEEVLQIKEVVAEVKAELSAEGIPYKDVEEGIMIETPAAALVSDELAKLVDFFSVGTNDLTQYTLAIDRQNSRLDAFYQPHHKAVLKLIQMAADNIHKEGKWIGICGELGADTSLTKTFIDMGIDELSVSASLVLLVRQAVREIED